jgi:hypothetical protein
LSNLDPQQVASRETGHFQPSPRPHPRLTLSLLAFRASKLSEASKLSVRRLVSHSVYLLHFLPSCLTLCLLASLVQKYLFSRTVDALLVQKYLRYWYKSTSFTGIADVTVRARAHTRPTKINPWLNLPGKSMASLLLSG